MADAIHAEAEQRRRKPAYALVYAGLVPVVQEIGRAHGYAIAVHGSMATDLDLIACPWTEEASDPDALIEAVCERLSVVYHPAQVNNNPSPRAHGRLAYSLVFDIADQFYVSGPYLDISVMPRLKGNASNE